MRLKALLGSLAFSLVIPGSVFGLIPCLITARYGAVLPLHLGPARAFGLAPMACGIVGYLWAAGTFLVVGKGTPAPTAPPTEFVAGGPYRYVRNPMYLSGLSLLAGEALFLQTALLLAYGALVGAAFHAFIVLYEEPVLRRQYGAAYESYCRAVSRWRPSLPRPLEHGSG